MSISMSLVLLASVFLFVASISGSYSAMAQNVFDFDYDNNNDDVGTDGVNIDQTTSTNTVNSTTSDDNNNDGSTIDDIEKDDPYARIPDWKEYIFFVFRFGIFFMIICFPCYRGIRIWYAAGGRILFRHSNDNNSNNNNNNDNDDNNDNNNSGRGYITGLRYQPADLDQWLVLSGIYVNDMYDNTNGGADGGGGINPLYQSKLTKEEVYALPEIVYQNKHGNNNEDDDDYDGDINDDNDNGNNGENKQEQDHSNKNSPIKSIGENDAKAGSRIQIEMGDHDKFDVNVDDHRININNVDNDTDNDDDDDGDDIGDVDNNNDDEAQQHQQHPITRPNRRRRYNDTTTTISTSCSICIDEFEEGEKIRLLPLCGHGYHTDCILPWLTERQGCCPYCKSQVICRVIDDDDDDDSHKEDNANANNNGDDIVYDIDIDTTVTTNNDNTDINNNGDGDNSNNNNANSQMIREAITLRGG